MAVLDNIKIELGIADSSKDDLLNLLIDNETANAITITHNDAAAEDGVLIAKMVIWRYNSMGTEGITGENYSGVSFSYSADYPKDIMQLLRSYKKIRVIAGSVD